ncbi:hypothetical protein FSARC_3563 [Fusarium sarcochroum]|uniref:Carboxylic ester hydrolase n=1 Tax=Fusarium sarcochroum TaxID=1208366 RepID=A0A8H4U3W3_9HYPO|nr:hypothetical protein FSARC_3563 [Fusarium sarcochroum]
MHLQTGLVAFSMGLFASALDIASRCNTDNINLPYIPGTKLLGTTAELVECVNFTAEPAHTWLTNNVTLNNYRLSGVGGGGLASLAGYGALGAAVARGYAAEYSYWNGYSTGGRQGLMLAQRYPGTYDGILAGAPAINWATFVPVNMCVFSAIVDAVLEACDELDGVKDGILSLPKEWDFRESGGKLLHWHGLQDQEIFVQGSENYYHRAEARHKHIRDFYRYLEAPGVAHCGGDGLLPNGPLAALVDWVEGGIAPDHLPAATGDGKQKRNLCPYPLVPSYTGGDYIKSSSYKSCLAAYTFALREIANAKD